MSLFQLSVLKFFHSFPLLMVQTTTVTYSEWYFTSSCCVLPTSRRNCETFVTLGPGGCASLKSASAFPIQKAGEKGSGVQGCKKTQAQIQQPWRFFREMLNRPRTHPSFLYCVSQGKLALQNLLTRDCSASGLIQGQKERCKKSYSLDFGLSFYVKMQGPLP